MTGVQTCALPIFPSHDMALSREYLLTAKTSDVSSASRGTSITVGGSSYTVRENRAIDDGIFSELLLSKV